MSLLDSVLSKVGLQRKPEVQPQPRRQQRISGAPLRRYAAGDSNRITYDWNPSVVTGDNAIRSMLQTLRARSRQLERDNNYWRRWLSALENNVLGADGVNLQMKIRFKSGRYDTSANEAIEEAWAEWGRPQMCSLSRDISWVDMQKLILRSTARDGGILIRKYRDPQTNPHGFTLQPIEIDMLDDGYNEYLPNGNAVRMGIETNSQQRVVAYYILDVHPGEYLFPIWARRDHIRVPAEDILHYYVKDRVTQSIGIPWGVSAMRSLHHIEEYIQAELIASRAASAKGGWFTSDRGDTFSGETERVEDEAGNITENTLNDFEPGSFDELPPGVSFNPYLPSHPTDAFGEFVRRIILETTAGLDSDYATITGDLSNANYSSMRSGKLEVWETYKKIQGHFITYLCLPIFEEWLKMAMLTQRITLPMSKFDSFNKPRFRGRRWAWVDPQKDVNSMLTAIDGGLKSRAEVIAENGGDLEDVFKDLAMEQEMAEEMGVQIVTPNTKQTATASGATETETAPASESEEEEPDEDEGEDRESEIDPGSDEKAARKDLTS